MRHTLSSPPLRLPLPRARLGFGFVAPDVDTPFLTSSRVPRLFFVHGKRSVFALCVALPLAFLVHLTLLNVYSRILGVPHHHGYFHHGPVPHFSDALGVERWTDVRHDAELDSNRLGPSTHQQHPSRPLPPAHVHSSCDDDEGAAGVGLHLPRPCLEREPQRGPDVSDTFATFKDAAECGLDSRDLHVPFTPLCGDKHAALDAMSSGGRAGFDQPFIPFGCDFRWYSTEEICGVLDRFSHIFFVGDSLHRMVVTALYMLLREDLGHGGVAEWDFVPSPTKGKDTIQRAEQCSCEAQFNRHECSHAPVRRYSEALRRSKKSTMPVCGRYLRAAAEGGGDGTASASPPFDMSYHEFQQYPIPDAQIDKLVLDLPQTKPDKPFALVMHHSFWNDLNQTATSRWIDQITERMTSYFDFLPKAWIGYHYPPGTRGFPRLFVTANAAGVMKNAAYIGTQNSGAIAKFESEMRGHLDFRQIDMLGFFNMSVQTTSSDGTHANMRTNLVKAMMVLNWLDWVGKDEGKTWNDSRE